MYDIPRVFSFKSNPDMFEKEREDIKNNTVRFIDFADERFQHLIHWAVVGWNDGYIKIEIKCLSNIIESLKFNL